MIWLVGEIAAALLICFVTGLAIGLAFRWRRRRIGSEEEERRRLLADAESDRLRLRISSLKASEERAQELDRELATVAPVAERVPKLEHEVATVKAQLIEVERELASAATEIGRLRTELQAVASDHVAELMARDRTVVDLRAKVAYAQQSSARGQRELMELADLRRRLRKAESTARLLIARDASIDDLRGELVQLRKRAERAEALQGIVAKPKKAKKKKKKKKATDKDKDRDKDSDRDSDNKVEPDP